MSTDRSKPRVLLADDHQGMMGAWHRVLGGWCDIVGSVAQDSEVVDAAARLRPDVIVLDVNMGERSGLDLCRQIKAEMPAIAVVLVSAAMNDDLRNDAREAGAWSFVSKFADVSELESAIRSAVSA